VIRRLVTGAAPWLKPGGRLMLELGDGQAETVTALLAAAGWGAVTVENDWTNRPRLLIAERAGA
jgi:release factor glutamine methyltransferase